MPFWVEQSQGAHKDSIEWIKQALKSGKISPKDAWDRYVPLYEKTSIRAAPRFEEHARGNGSSVDYMLAYWFPHFANTFYSGYEKNCINWVREHTTKTEKYHICYEY